MFRRDTSHQRVYFLRCIKAPATDDLFISSDLRVLASGLSDVTLPSRYDEQWACCRPAPATFLYLALDQTPSVHVLLYCTLDLLHGQHI